MQKLILIIAVLGLAFIVYVQVQKQPEEENSALVEQQETQQDQGMTIEKIKENIGFELEDKDENQGVFDVIGTNFEFSIKEIRVKKGSTVQINFTSAEGLHDWVVDEFDARSERGNSSIVIFEADKAGEFEYYCSVENHRALGMIGKLIIEE